MRSCAPTPREVYNDTVCLPDEIYPHHIAFSLPVLPHHIAFSLPVLPVTIHLYFPAAAAAAAAVRRPTLSVENVEWWISCAEDIELLFLCYRTFL